jgi:Redoxin
MLGRLPPGALLLSSVVLCGSIGLAAAEIRVPNLGGVLLNPLQASPATKAVVLVFVSTECPYSNRSAPEIRRIHDAFEPRGVRFWLVYPNPADTSAIIRAHLSAFGYPDIALRDSHHDLVKLAGPTVTPEAAVFDAKGNLVYRGRIDDRFVELGRERPAPTKHDLEDALASTLAGKPVAPSSTQAFGCFISDLR